MKQLHVTSPPGVYIEAVELEESRYISYGKIWTANTLIKACRDQDLKQFDMPLAGINLSAIPWGQTSSVDDLAYHFKRAMNSNLKYPIIIDWRGYIADGWHRVLKALLEDRKTVKAYRLNTMPEHDSVTTDNNSN
jgi:hypothetical protein